VADEPYWLEEAPAKITAEQREKWMKAGFTLSKTDDSWPIPNAAFLDKAIGSWGRAVAAGNTAQVKRHILKHARRLKVSAEKIKQIQALGTGTKEARVAENSTLPLSNRDFRVELGRALVGDTTFARDMAVAAAKALSGDPLQEAERSHDQTRQAVSQALRDKYRQGDDDFGPWIREMYDDKVVFEHDGDTFESSFTIDDQDNVTLGDRIEVEIKYVPVVTPASESDAGIGEGDGIPTDDLVPLVEAWVPLVEKALRSDGSAAVKIIEPGQGSSGRYDPDVLERDGSAAFPKGTKMYWDHPTETEERERPERSLRDVAATTITDPYFTESGPDGPGLYTDAQVLSQYRETVEELAPHIGVSIRALGLVNEHDGEAVVEKIAASPHNSIDFVTEPGAGGKVVELFESARGRRSPAPRKEEPQMAEVKDLQEANRKLTEAEQQLAEARQKVETTEKERDEATQDRDRLREANIIREAKDTAYAAFDALKEKSQVDLPQMTRDRLAESLSKNPPTTDDGAFDKEAFEKTVAEAVKAEVKYLAEVTGSGRITGMGPSDGEPDAEEIEKQMAESLRTLGLSEEGAKKAAAGR